MIDEKKTFKNLIIHKLFSNNKTTIITKQTKELVQNHFKMHQARALTFNRYFTERVLNVTPPTTNFLYIS